MGPCPGDSFHLLSLCKHAWVQRWLLVQMYSALCHHPFGVGEDSGYPLALPPFSLFVLESPHLFHSQSHNAHYYTILGTFLARPCFWTLVILQYQRSSIHYPFNVRGASLVFTLCFLSLLPPLASCNPPGASWCWSLNKLSLRQTPRRAGSVCEYAKGS